ncbi:MAG: hypothetical protein WDO73_29525 [Ignavibacteriota bacterium]
MRRLALLILIQSTALADGGTVQFRSEAGPYVITLFTTPTPLTAGPIDISLLLQDRDGLTPVLDADVLWYSDRDRRRPKSKRRRITARRAISCSTRPSWGRWKPDGGKSPSRCGGTVCGRKLAAPSR